MKNSKSKLTFINLSLIPAFLLYIVFILYPTFTVFKSSLYKKTAYTIGNGEFVGLNNFKILMDDPKFIKAFQNTIFLMVIVTVITMFLAIIFAAILTREDLKGKNFLRIIFYVPNILSIAVVAAIFAAIYGMDNGLINGLGKLFNPETWTNIPFLGDRKIVNYSIVAAMVWQAVGYYMVMYMSTMSQIPNHLYEAAEIDGASKFKQFFDITLPLSWETVRTTLTFYVISNINIAFQIIKALTGGGPDGASTTLLNYQYDQAYSNLSFGYGLAIGVVVFLFSFILSAIISRITNRDSVQF
ncbi:carbohydrate ABC transporter permease [uncultured Helcococcus sp.]|uniref:carbohydrate ABC transporter permease n=1 Tax=uncultured Helcococcus sp. TaxID=1072508 RepID=UPI00263216F3|nr:sugar ABC transporter permease [uncultured Helcococcus sp.]